MLLDAEKRESGWFRDKIFDVCIVGTGPAGLSLALRLAEKGRKVGLFEGGGLKATQESADIYDGRIAGLDYFPLRSTRLRYLGGTSNHWNGWCRALDAYDFEPHAHEPYSGWPIRAADLQPYAADTEKILDLGPPNPSFDLFGGDNGSLLPFEFRWSKPTRFGDKYKDALAASPKIQVFLNANLVDVDLPARGGSVTAASFRSYARPEPFTVRARYFVLCLGGLENPRFLLNANRQIPAGVGNENGLVGRFFCEHMHFHLGKMMLEPKLQKGLPGHLFFRPQPEFLVANKIVNFGIRLEGLSHPADSPLGSLARRGICSSWTLTRVADAIRGTSMACYDGDISVIAAQQLNPDSRVTLDEARDRFGQRRMALDWRLSETDKRTLKVAAVEFGSQLARRDAGRLNINPWVLDPKPTFPKIGQEEVAGHHHMCTTRMSDDPRNGVVDRNCRVHSVDNLYLGGSSVFATPGFANPTYAIVQLALRLADHIDSRLAARG